MLPRIRTARHLSNQKRGEQPPCAGNRLRRRLKSLPDEACLGCRSGAVVWGCGMGCRGGVRGGCHTGGDMFGARAAKRFCAVSGRACDLRLRKSRKKPGSERRKNAAPPFGENIEKQAPFAMQQVSRPPAFLKIHVAVFEEGGGGVFGGDYGGGDRPGYA